MQVAYPLSTFTYAIVPTVTSKKFLLEQFLLYAMRQGQKFGPALDFAPIPKVVNKAGIATVHGSSRRAIAPVPSGTPGRCRIMPAGLGFFAS